MLLGRFTAWFEVALITARDAHGDRPTFRKFSRHAMKASSIGLIGALALFLSREAAATPILINTVTDLENINSNLAGDYELNANIDASSFSFVPIGTSSTPFTGTLDGNGFTVSNLSAVTSRQQESAALFVSIGASGLVNDLSLTNARMGGFVGGGDFGGAAGIAMTNFGTISNSSISGSVSGTEAGGLVSDNRGTIISSQASVQVSGFAAIGGIAAVNDGIIAQSSSQGTVGSGNPANGFGAAAGGLVGVNYGTITSSSSTAEVAGCCSGVGGLVGANGPSGTVLNSSASGVVANVDANCVGCFLQGGKYGGLVGTNEGSVGQSLATGSFGRGVTTASGLSGSNSGTVSSSYWDTQTSGTATSFGGAGLTTAQLQSGTLPTGFDPTVWSASAGQYPQLKWQTTSVSPSAATLARMSQAAYSPADPSSIDGFTLINGLVVAPTSGVDGFSANVYRRGNQIVVAFRGTALGFDMTFIENLISDTPFATCQLAPASCKVSPELSNNLSQAIALLQSIQSDKQFAGAQITLTGHSLGGAMAQMLGKQTGYPVVAFDAPGGGGPLFAAVADQFGATWTNISGLSGLSGSTNQNVRTYGDQISLVGTAIGTSITVPTDQKLLTDAATLDLMLHNHIDLDNLITQLELGAVSPDPGPEYCLPCIVSVPLGLEVIAGSIAEGFAITGVEAGVHRLFPAPDPLTYTFVENPGSPKFASLTLPLLEGISNYLISYEIGSTWSLDQIIAPATLLNFGVGVDGFTVQALDDIGQIVPIDDSLFLDVTFASSGDFSGTLTATTPIEAVPEPNTGALFVPTLLGLIFLYRSRSNLGKFRPSSRTVAQVDAFILSKSRGRKRRRT